MKKLKLDLNDLKVESFVIPNNAQSLKGTIKGQERLKDSDGAGGVGLNAACGGGGGGIGTNTWCFGEACQSQDYMYTCQGSCPNPDLCGGGGYGETQYYSCNCTDPDYDPACSTWYPSNTCPPI